MCLLLLPLALSNGYPTVHSICQPQFPLETYNPSCKVCARGFLAHHLLSTLIPGTQFFTWVGWNMQPEGTNLLTNLTWESPAHCRLLPPVGLEPTTYCIVSVIYWSSKLEEPLLNWKMQNCPVIEFPYLSIELSCLSLMLTENLCHIGFSHQPLQLNCT